MKMKSQYLAAAIFTIAALAFVARPVHAGCGEADPDCPPSPPQSRQVAIITRPGPEPLSDPFAEPVQPQSLSMPLPMDLEPVLAEAPHLTRIADNTKKLSVPLRQQDASDVSCGVQALGMALEVFEADAPTSSAILNQLNLQGHMYEFGTGAEELAFAAQSLGYEGSVAFHGWNIENLRSELDAGRPVVVDLGANGTKQPGHFVTLTGISEDWQWVTYNDPLLGERTVALAEFMRLWDMQGNSGVSVAVAAPSTSSPDYHAWTALATAMMATLALGPGVLKDLRRKGAGGGIRSSTTTSLPAKPVETPVEGPIELPHDPPPPENPVLVKIPYTASIVVGERIIGGHWEDRAKYVEPRWETISPGHWEWQERQVAYTAYRPKSVLVQKVVNVVKEVTEKVTTWVRTKVVKPVTQWVKKTIREPVTKWVRRTKTWFEKTWFGKWIRKTRSWVEKKVSWVKKTVWEPVKRWVTEEVVKPVTRYVKRTIVEPIKKLVRQVFMEPYTAYRTERVEVFTPPVKRYIPGYYETKQVWVEDTVPITELVTNWKEIYVDAGDLPDWVARDFFERMDPSLSRDEQMAHFAAFRDIVAMFSGGSENTFYSQALQIFFEGIPSNITTSGMLENSFGTGEDAWQQYNDSDEFHAQYFHLRKLAVQWGWDDAYSYESRHTALCGELATIAALGESIRAGLTNFNELYPHILKDNGESTDEYTYYTHIEGFFDSYGWSAGHETGSVKPEDLTSQLQSGQAVVALVNLNQISGILEPGTTANHVPHWITVLGILPTNSGDKLVRVYNPFDNQEEYYTWDEFSDAWKNTNGNNSEYLRVTAQAEEEDS